MQNSSLIWIPSLQNYLRFKELSTNQYKSILKEVNHQDEIEFYYHINKILSDNIVSKFNIDNLTTIDRFIVCAFLKMRSCSHEISLTRVCEKCKSSSTIEINLSMFINEISTKIDKKFAQSFNYEIYDCVCDIPSIKSEYDIHENSMIKHEDKTSMDNIHDNYLISHIKELSVMGQNTNFSELPLIHKKAVFAQLPAGLIDIIKNSFIFPIHESLSNINFIDINCKSCKEKFNLKFQINFISDLIKILFRDNSITSLLMDIFNLSISSHVSANFLMDLAPYELNQMIEFMKEANKQKSQEGPKQENLFESPSEFAGI